MNTLEYLQLTYKQKTCSSIDIMDLENNIMSYIGIFITKNIVRCWNSNNKLYCEYKVKNNREHGISKVWNNNGKLVKHELWRNGKLIKNFLEEK